MPAVTVTGPGVASRRDRLPGIPLPALYALHPEKFQSVDKRLAADHKGHVFEAPEGRPVHVVTDMEQGLLFHSLSNAVRKCFEPKCR